MISWLNKIALILAKYVREKKKIKYKENDMSIKTFRMEKKANLFDFSSADNKLRLN